MIIRNAIKKIIQPKDTTSYTLPEMVSLISPRSSSGKIVTPESSKNIATAYRCGNILSDDVGKMPLQTFNRGTGTIDRVNPNRMMNIAYLLEISPNRWMNPFIFKKTMMQWLIFWGNAYAWMPIRNYNERREIVILGADVTWPVYDQDGNVWYRTQFPNGKIDFLPNTDVLHLKINSTDGIMGKSVISYAMESLGRQLGAYETQSGFFSKGLSSGGILWAAGELNKEARKKLRDQYEEVMSGSQNASRVAILDQTITKFEKVSMNPVDAQFLESIQANDTEIANFFGVPQYKLNAGKQSYESNSQQDLDYMKTTLDPYLVQWEQEAALKWLTEDEQLYMYLRFNRDAILRTDSKTRSEVLNKQILSGMLSPNEARQIEDLSRYDGGDIRLVPSNMAVVTPEGVSAISKSVNGGTEEK